LKWVADVAIVQAAAAADADEPGGIAVIINRGVISSATAHFAVAADGSPRTLADARPAA
jgi:hypothetical protein